MRFIRCLLLLLGALAPGADALAQADAPRNNARTLVVGIKTAPPFVIERGDDYTGLSIGLWQEIAAEHGWRYEFRSYDLQALLDAVAAGEVDVAIGAITATAAREERMEFSHPITSSGLGVAVRSQQSAGWVAVARAFFSLAFLKVLLALGALLLAIGTLAWLFERRRNAEQFGGTPARASARASGGRR